MYRLISLLIGYVFGNFLMADVVAKKYTGKKASEIGSGNPGMANVMAQCGFGAGLLVLAGDLAKTVIPCVLVRFLLFPDHGLTACAYAGLGAVLGHDFPAAVRFRGGKGVSSTCAAIFCISPLWGLLSMTVGMYIVFASQYLGLGAVFIPLAFTGVSWLLFKSPELTFVLLLESVLMFQRHFPAFRNIRKGTEKRVDVAGLLKKKFGRFTILITIACTIVLFLIAMHPWYVDYMRTDHIQTCARSRYCIVLDFENAKTSVAAGGIAFGREEALTAVRESLEDHFGVTISDFGEPVAGGCLGGGTWTILYDEETGEITTYCTAQDHEEISETEGLYQLGND